VTAAAEAYKFHHAMRAVGEFCRHDLSGVYFIAVESRLNRPDEGSRRATQTVLYHAAEVLARLLAPTLSFLAEDIWEHLPQGERPASAQLAEWPTAPAGWRDDELAARWEQILALRHRVFQALNSARETGEKFPPAKTKVIIYSAGENRGLLESLRDDFTEILPVSAVEFASREKTPADLSYSDDELAIQLERNNNFDFFSWAA